MVVLGPTASGKTAFAAKLAARTETEIISADSRQVYRGMDLGTGKDYDDYIVNGKQIPVHLIDVVDAGYKYNVYEYQRDFVKVFEEISREEKVPVLCGGTGMYIEAVLKGYRLIEVPENQKLRKDLKGMNMAELERRLKSFKKLHNTTDITQKKRLIRAIEIEEYYQVHEQKDVNYPDIKPLIIGINVDRETRRSRITERLKKRLETGMVEEVKYLLGKDIDPDTLIYYGLEYKFITMYLLGKLSYEEMFKRLETAIHQFAKRQMTWFRGMERRGYRIHWIDGLLPMDEKIRMVQEKLSFL
jgi:tRNA dimethylallyltransferase